MTERARPPEKRAERVLPGQLFPQETSPDSAAYRPGPSPGRENNAKNLGFSTKISEDVEKPIGECIFLRKNVVK